MKKIIMSALATVCLLTALPSAVAQEPGKGIVIENFSSEISGKMLDIGFSVTASGLELKCDGQLKLEFAVESVDHRMVLPVVVYSGNQRYRYEQRRSLLSDHYSVEPYRIFRGVKKNRVYELDYKLSVPYYTWMEHASVTYREYTHDCGGDNLTGGGPLVADLNPAPTYIEPEIWKPDPALMPNLVRFLVPEVEEVKARASMIELNINFPVNITEVRPTYMNNPRELQRADSLVTVLHSNSLLTINGVTIRGYASPEGTYVSNERLAKGRSESFKQYLVRKYPSNEFLRRATTLWTPEDWDGLELLVMENDIDKKDEVLAVIRSQSMSPDSKEKALQDIYRWSDNYKILLKDMYPKLRRIELRVDYTVHNLTDNQAKELLYTNPEMLSLEEMYRVARFYDHDSKQYREVYEIAARQYPDDVIANNNAAAALLWDGNAEAALPYLEKTKGNDTALINYGAYYYISGDLDKALEYFTKAKEAGNEQAEHNLKLVNPANK